MAFNALHIAALKGPSFSMDLNCFVAESIKDGPLRRRMHYSTGFERGISD